MAKPPQPFTPQQERIGNTVVQAMSRVNTWVYRLTGGRIGGKFLRGAPVFLLITIGRRSGERRTAPLLYLRDGDRYLIVASKGGMSHHPTWYLNIEANPNVEIELGRTTMAMTARRLSDEEKAAVWPKLVAMYSDYDDYQARTSRNIPVIALTPRS